MATKQHFIEQADDFGDPLSGFIQSVASDWSVHTVSTRYFDCKDYWNWLCQQDLDPSQTSTVKRYLDHCRANDLSDGTVYSRYKSIKKLYDHMLMDNPNHAMHPYKDTSGETVSALASKKYNDKGKTEREKQTNETPRLTPEQVDQLLDHVPTPRLRNKIIISLFNETGVRNNELRHIKLTDLNLDDDKMNNTNRRVAEGDDRSLHIRRAKGANGSGPRERFVVIPSDLAFKINQYVYGGYRDESPHAESSEYLFVTAESDQISRTAIIRMLHKASGMNREYHESHGSAGITEPQWIDARGRTHGPVHAHAFRHSYIYNKLEEGVPPRVLMKWTGHQDLDLILRYSEMSDEESIQQGMKYIP